MDSWNKVEKIEKIINIFGEVIGFHDAEIINVKYDGKNAAIKIDSEGFIKTKSNSDSKYNIYKNVYVTINFKSIISFEIDYDYGMNFINEITMESDDKYFTVVMDGYYLKIVCEQIEIDNVDVIYKQEDKQNIMLDKLLKSNI